ncbi:MULTISPECIES: beta-ketoacyl synthase N-terminal-like domain-containing protein [unclassified Mesorhizobium]|uniref:beta-ketoacyl synthase N-terminal-like domain-containing protein n=1 Tax=unclassified Mesorhizobium TaxID=325217 RepID=UPI0004B20024|nr:beta-ketoacyl synthase N-terminal-like domain-containing protein [Mesorhizobium sp. WSM1293]
MTKDGETITVARVPARSRLRQNEGEWLANMAARAINEAMRTGQVRTEATAILMTPPESFREHSAYGDIRPPAFLGAIIAATGQHFHPASRAVDGGAAASLGLLERAIYILETEGAEQVLLGGVDSLVNDTDLARLARAGRLVGDDNAQGLVPGEAAVFVCLTREPKTVGPVHVAIHGVGTAQESDGVLSERFSQGRAMLGALRDAISGSGPAEPDINFVVSNGNGERYSGWEQLMVRQRFYRTRREVLPTAYPAMTIGDIGAAGGAMALMLAADSFMNDYAPGPTAMCEVASEGGLRAAAVMAGMTRP